MNRIGMYLSARWAGERVSTLITKASVRNADYLFRHHKIVMELKILETEFAHAPNILVKLASLIRQQALQPDANFYRDYFRILRAPLQRVIKTANRQIKETKIELGLTKYSGIMICVNDSFRGIRPGMVMSLLSDTLAGESYNSVDCLIYQTNHYVEIAESPGTVLLWAPIYSPKVGPEIVNFVNDLGRSWRRYRNQIEGPSDFSEERESIDWDKACVADGPLRHREYVDPKKQG